MKQRVISSPPYEIMPTFDWSTIEHFGISHIGLPEKWEFPWADVGFTNNELKLSDEDKMKFLEK